jgi:hypothetical protein
MKQSSKYEVNLTATLNLEFETRTGDCIKAGDLTSLRITRKKVFNK